MDLLLRCDYTHFYPRSPCGERPNTSKKERMLTDISIHALLAESDSKLLLQQHRNRNFYPRSPCGERQAQDGYKDTVTEFLSTLSLRRATHIRSTSHGRRGISIHALLAESDFTAACIFLSMPKFLSTLSLRRATLVDTIAPDQKTRFLSTLSLRRATPAPPLYKRHELDFYPRSPCGERPP